MAVKIYDSTTQAFVDADVPKVYSSTDSAFVDAGGKVKVGDEWEDVTDKKLQSITYTMTTSDSFENFIPIHSTNKTMTPYSNGTQLLSTDNYFAVYEIPINPGKKADTDFEIGMELCIYPTNDALAYFFMLLSDSSITSDIVNKTVSDIKTTSSYLRLFVVDFWTSYANFGTTVSKFEDELVKIGQTPIVATNEDSTEYAILKVSRKNSTLIAGINFRDADYTSTPIPDNTDITNMHLYLLFTKYDSYTMNDNRIRNIYFGEPRE